MNTHKFYIIIDVIEAGRGPKLKSDTAQDALLHLTSGAKVGRYAKRLASRVLEVEQVLSSNDGTKIAALNIYAKLNATESDDSMHAAWMVYSKGHTPSKAAMLTGTYSARVYTLCAAVDKLYETINRS
tara:strand:- start:650 stop:1033 length:384 start_codon:yes stop_codon:yes gene_type:complete